MTSFVSAGVYTSELDFSLYVPALSTTKLGLVTTASKGPVDERTSVTTEEQLYNKFGIPDDQHEGLMAAVQYLREGNNIEVVRVAGYNEATATGAGRNSGDTANAVVFTPVESGSWANGSSGLTIDIAEGSVSSTYKLTVKWRGSIVEIYDAVVLTPSTSDDYIETRMANSSYVTAEVESGQTTLKTGSTVSFSGGNDGHNTTVSDVLGTIVGTTRTGLKLFSNPEVVDINVLAVPGDTRGAVISEMLSIAESRADSIALIDPPYGLDADEVIEWHNGESGLSGAPAAALNSSYGALYWPWIRAYDGWSDTNVYVPPSGVAAAALALTDREYETWYAPAGTRRGLVKGAIGSEYSPTQGEREKLYGGRAGTHGINAVNPIVNFTGEGLIIWGQRTLQRSSTSLDRIGPRRMLLYLRKVIATAAKYLVFEPNDDRMWADFKNLVVPFLRRVKDSRGLYDYRVIMDSSTNTPDLIDRGEAFGRILLKPVKAAEVISIQFSLLPTGARFEEFLLSPNAF